MKKSYQHTLWSAALVLLLSLCSVTAFAANYTINMPPENVSICKADLPYSWMEKDRTAAGKYTERVTSPDQREDVTTKVDTVRVYTLNLKTFDYYIDDKYFELCDECSFSYNGKTYTYNAPGVYNDTIKKSDPCPTVLRLHVFKQTEWHFYDTVHWCAGSTYDWYGQQLTEYGDYVAEDADSLRFLHLIMHNTVERFDTVSICQGEEYWWMKNKYTQTGDYTNSKLKTRYGCDSICHLHLDVLPVPVPVHFYDSVCQGSYIERTSLIDGHKIKITKDTVYNDTIKSSNMCDSVISWHFYFKPSFFQEDVIQHFEGDAVEWHDKTYTKDGIYQDSALNRFQCDSIWQLRLITKYELYRQITRCDGDTAMHGKTVVTQNTVFIDTLLSSKGADSIIHTTYNFVEPFYSRESITICESDIVEWTGHFADHKNPYLIDPVTGDSTPVYMMLEATADNSPRTFYDTYHLDNGCDSTYEITVTAQKAYYKDTLVIWCKDSLDKYGPFEWIDMYGNPQQWSAHDIDTVIITSLGSTQPDPSHSTTGGEGWTPITGGCDSLERLRLIVTESCSLDTVYLCPGGSLSIDGFTYTKPGRYANWMPSFGSDVRDSLHTFDIIQAEAKEVDVYQLVRQSELPYKWYGKLLYTTGVYHQTDQTIHGCDSIIHLHLTVAPTKYADGGTVDFCIGQDQEIILPHSGHVITPKSNTDNYLDTVPYQFSFVDGEGHTQSIMADSVVTYHLVGHGSFFKNEEDVIKKGGTYVWHDHGQTRIIDQPGVYFDSCTNIWGCDSVYRLYLVEVENWYFPTTAYVCQNDLPYVWHGKDLYKDSTYFDSLPTQHGMDSVYELRLFVQKAYVIDTFVYICHDDIYRHNGKVIPIEESVSAYIFDDTLKTRFTGCDSIYRYHLYRTPKTITSDTVIYIEKGNTCTWNRTGKEYSALGFYYDTIRSPHTNCDSIIYTLEVREDQPLHDTLRVSVCKSEMPYLWRGRPIDKDTILEDRWKTTFLGLDSVYRLELTVLPTYYFSETKYLCPGEGYNFKSQYITTPGVYYDSLISSDLCDSIHVLNLIPAPKYFFPETMTYVYDNELPLLWHGKLLPGEGIYYDSLTTQVGHPCDSVYQVTVLHTQTYNFEVNESICEGTYFEWEGDKYFESGDYTKRYKSIHNLDSIRTLHLTVNEVKVTHISRNLCKGETFPFLDTVLTEPTIYRDTLINPNTLCDSIFEVVVNWYDNSETVINHILCGNKTLQLNGVDITHEGVYYETTKAQSSGCDSVTKHIVTIGTPYYTEEKYVIRKGESYTWHHCGVPVTLYQEGEYWDSCHTALGCDSVMKLTLAFFKDVVFPTRYDTICYSDLPYMWDTYPITKAVTEEGLRYDTCFGNGADTIRSLHLTIIPTVRASETLEFCYGESHVINGVRYTEDAVVTDTLPGKHGCDSIVTYHLKFYPRYEETRTIKLTSARPTYDVTKADGEVVTIRTKGVYVYHYESVHGCDSMVTFIVDECTTPIVHTIPYNICKGDAIIINGKRITQAGSYDFFFSSIDGCDSIVRYVVKENPSFEKEETATMCKNSVYVWRGHRHDTLITRQGTYFDSLKTKLGCDSVYILKLSYKRTDLIDSIIPWCASDLPYSYKNKEYYEDNVFYDTLANNIEGCDSVIRYTYKVNYHCSAYDQYHRCVGQTKIIDNMVIDHEGTYYHHHLTADGQDSLYRFTVHDVTPFRDTVRRSGCDSIEFRGKMYYARGPGREHFGVDLTFPLIDEEGCDSLIHLDLTINMSSPTHVYSKTIADFDSVPFGPFYYNTPGPHSITYTNIHGCDSTEILQLTVLETEYPEIVHYQLCAGDPRGIEVFGKRYTADQEYTYIVDTTWLAGRPVIRTADITVRNPFIITRFDAQENQLICSDFETLFNVNFTAADPMNLPDYYAVDFLVGDFEAHPMHQEHPVNGKTTLDISMHGQGKYIIPGNYRYRLKFWSAACEYNDTTFEGSILVRYPADVMESSWDDAVMLVNEKYNGGNWVFKAPYRWQVLSSQGVDKTALVAGDATQPYLYSPALEEGDRIIATLIREGYDQPIPSCEYIFTPTHSILTNAILVYPSAVKARMPITVSSNHAGTFRLMDYTGRTYSTGSFIEGETQITMPGVEGCYIIVLKDEQGNKKTQKLIVY